MQDIATGQQFVPLPPPRCGTCKHWSSHGNRDGLNWGLCQLIQYGDGIIRLAEITDVACLVTQTDFGCVLHEPREPSPSPPSG